MARYQLGTAAIVAGLLYAAPACAAPNVFWIFGFTPGYGHGAGGRAAADIGTEQASVAPLPQIPAADASAALPSAPVLEYAALDTLIPTPRPAGLPDL